MGKKLGQFLYRAGIGALGIKCLLSFSGCDLIQEPGYDVRDLIFKYKGQEIVANINTELGRDSDVLGSDAYFIYDGKKFNVLFDKTGNFMYIAIENISPAKRIAFKLEEADILLNIHDADGDGRPNSIEEEFVFNRDTFYSTTLGERFSPLRFSLSGAARSDLSMGNIDFSDPSKNIWSGDIEYVKSFLTRYKNLSDQYIGIVGALQDSLHSKMHGGSGVSNQNLENRERQKSFGGKQNSIFKQQNLRAMGNGSRRFR